MGDKANIFYSGITGLSYCISFRISAHGGSLYNKQLYSRWHQLSNLNSPILKLLFYLCGPAVMLEPKALTV